MHKLFLGKNKNIYYEEIVLLNTAAILVISEKCKTIKEGIKIARDNLLNGNGLKKLIELIDYSNK